MLLTLPFHAASSMRFYSVYDLEDCLFTIYWNSPCHTATFTNSSCQQHEIFSIYDLLNKVHPAVRPCCHAANFTNSCCQQHEIFLYLLYIEIHPVILSCCYTYLFILPAAWIFSLPSIYWIKFILPYAVWDFSLSTIYWIKFILPYLLPCCQLYQFMLPAAGDFSLSNIYWSSSCRSAYFTNSFCQQHGVWNIYLFSFKRCSSHADMLLTLPVYPAVRPCC